MKTLGLLVVGTLLLALESAYAGCNSGRGYYCKSDTSLANTELICFTAYEVKSRDLCVKYSDAKYGTASKRKAAHKSLIGADDKSIFEGLSSYVDSVDTLKKNIKSTAEATDELNEKLEDEKDALAREARKLGLKVTGKGLSIAATGNLSIAQLKDLTAKAEALQAKYDKSTADIQSQINKNRADLDAYFLKLDEAEEELYRQTASGLEKAEDKARAKKLLALIEKAKKKIKDGDLDEVLEDSEFKMVEIKDIIEAVEEIHDDAEMGLYMQAKLSRVESNFCGAVKQCQEGKEADLGLDDVFSRKTKSSGKSSYKRRKRSGQ